jgi:hypothetical protein
MQGGGAMTKKPKRLNKLSGADEYKIGQPGDNVSNGAYGLTREEILAARSEGLEEYLPVRPTRSRSGWFL